MHWQLLAAKSMLFDLLIVIVAEFLESFEEVYAQEYSQSDIGIEADQYRCWQVSSMCISII